MEKSIVFDHEQNHNSYSSAEQGIALLRKHFNFDSVLDLGCGSGEWLKACQDSGSTEIFGVDGIFVGADKLKFPDKYFAQHDLTQSLDLERQFDLVMSLEVAEHLPESASATFIQNICRHGKQVLFSAAIPRQPGQHHINCQGLDFWQKHFNDNGYVCSDNMRYDLWCLEGVHWWYQQNVFTARHDPDGAGQEPRLRTFVDPKMLELYIYPPETFRAFFSRQVRSAFPMLFGKKDAQD